LLRRSRWLGAKHGIELLEASKQLLGVRVVAVEAKLYRIEEALLQAANALSYADQSYVLMPESVRRMISGDTRAAFRQLGIGLLLQGYDRAKTSVSPSTQLPTSAANKLFVADRLLRISLKRD
jgi:hypothetical protein